MPFDKCTEFLCEFVNSILPFPSDGTGTQRGKKRHESM